jgi:hypothetical protein
MSQRVARYPERRVGVFDHGLAGTAFMHVWTLFWAQERATIEYRQFRTLRPIHDRSKCTLYGGLR